MNQKFAKLNVAVKTVDDVKHQIRFVMSTPDVDRHGEVIDQKGWKLDNFLKNPVVLWSHDHTQPAIGKIVDIGYTDGNLEGTVQFAAEEYEFAATIYRLYAGGYMNAVSVGFNNVKWSYDETDDLLTLVENELYELSAVTIPANAMALAKSKGIDISSIERRLDRTDAVNEKLLGEPEQVEPEISEAEPEHECEKSAVTTADALTVLVEAPAEEIRAAVKELSSRLDVAQDVVTDDRKMYSVSSINRVARQLVNGKRQARE
jgi:HK97 family phage prohead protease